MSRFSYLATAAFAAIGHAAGAGAETPAWTAVEASDGSAPVARHEAAFVDVGDQLFLLGGRGIKPVDIYDTATGEWRHGAEPPIEIHHFQAVPWQDEIWVVGAFTGGYPGETPIPHVLIYDPEADSWRQGPDMPQDRLRGSTGAAVVDDLIYIAGGAQDGHRSGHVAWLDRLDPQTGAWVRLADAPRPRDHGGLAHVDGKLVFAGGRLSMAPDKTFSEVIPEVDIYDIAADSWTTVDAPLPTPRAGNAVVALGDEVLVIGGESASQPEAHAEVEVLNPRTGAWRSGTPLLRGRHGTGAAVLGNQVWIAAGSGNRGGGPELDTLERYAE
ncbi:MAG: kelch repeat-containing protein [Pseudomonadota bacterium]